ncbi:MAG: 3D-(3,5/4)-trihydroxycyclohexane-1,2-dione acylhydrolase (decyclizing) [Kiloniellales bacterium]|nr:3D-(3,5/4)-trihydroxycyclohexane-1,2-dione acylhydrolase (decyclizing) [Kiloniellales bacterium]
MRTDTIRLTMAQAVVRYLCAQETEIDGQRVPLFAGVFGIFGHGNVTCLAEALEAVQDRLPTWRGQNEQSMTLAAIAYAKAKKRRQLMVATSSIGPGATNMVTAAGVAMSNRLPVLLLSGDVFANRRPDPVLQQVEHFGNPTVSVNDAFKPVTRYWDRITHPEQIIASLPQAVAVMLDPADCGPAFIGLCQDTQEIAFDYPAAFFETRVHKVPRPRPDRERVAEAAEILRGAKKPLVIAGGGLRYSGAEARLTAFAAVHGLPVAETIAGKGSLVHDDPAHVGPMGVIGSASANALAEEADVVLAIGTRLQDFTTGSWSAFRPDARFVSINAARFDAVKHRALPVVGDALETLEELGAALGDWSADAGWMQKGRDAFAAWNALLDDRQAPTNAPVPTYAQVVGAVNRKAGARDLMVAAAGGLPGEVSKGWKVKSPGTFDCEFGFSCMGYEIAGGWGAAMADDSRDTLVLTGDGSYLMMNSDIYSTVLTGHKMIVVVCDNGGFAVINRLQNFKGGASFNNLIKDCRVKAPFAVDFVKHAESMGALARKVESIADLEQALDWAKGNDRTTVISIVTDGFDWTPGDAWWDVGVPETSERKEVQQARADHVAGRGKQRVGV